MRKCKGIINSTSSWSIHDPHVRRSESCLWSSASGGYNDIWNNIFNCALVWNYVGLQSERLKWWVWQERVPEVTSLTGKSLMWWVWQERASEVISLAGKGIWSDESGRTGRQKWQTWQERCVKWRAWQEIVSELTSLTGKCVWSDDSDRKVCLMWQVWQVHNQLNCSNQHSYLTTLAGEVEAPMVLPRMQWGSW